MWGGQRDVGETLKSCVTQDETRTVILFIINYSSKSVSNTVVETAEVTQSLEEGVCLSSCVSGLHKQGVQIL